VILNFAKPPIPKPLQPIRVGHRPVITRNTLPNIVDAMIKRHNRPCIAKKDPIIFHPNDSHLRL
jgi:hypothetical protein